MPPRVRGFTLVELLIVLAVLAVISAIAISYFMSAVQRSREAAAVGYLRHIQAAQENYRIAHKEYADTFTKLAPYMTASLESPPSPGGMSDSFLAAVALAAPRQGGTPPGQGGTPPGQGGTPPGQGGTPPGQGGTPLVKVERHPVKVAPRQGKVAQRLVRVGPVLEERAHLARHLGKIQLSTPCTYSAWYVPNHCVGSVRLSRCAIGRETSSSAPITRTSSASRLAQFQTPQVRRSRSPRETFSFADISGLGWGKGWRSQVESRVCRWHHPRCCSRGAGGQLGLPALRAGASLAN